MNDGVNAGVAPREYPPLSGSQPRTELKTRMSISPTQKYGIAVVNTSSGGRVLSRRLPRRHAAMAPTPVPTANARTVVVPTSPTVHQMPVAM